MATGVRVLLRLIGLVALISAGPVWANSVYVSNASFPPQISGPAPTGTFQCQQSGGASAFCQSNYSAFYGLVAGGGSSEGTAGFGLLTGAMQEAGGGSGYLSTSFGENVVVTGGSGAGTLVAHYALASSGEALLVNSALAGGFSFVQGASSSIASPVFLNFGFATPNLNPPAGCEMVGLCFSKTVDIASPITFGTALPVEASAYLSSDGFGELPMAEGGGLNVSTSLRLTGFTVLNASGSVVGDAIVASQNAPGVNLFPTPEPQTWTLMLIGAGSLGGQAVMCVWSRLMGRS